MERGAVVLAAEETDVAITGGVKSQRSRAITQRHHQAQGPLFTDDRLLGWTPGKRTDPPQTQ